MNVEGIIETAYEISNQFEHEYMTVEHVVLALIKDKEIKKILKECNVDTKQLEADIVTYLNDDQYNNLKSEGGSTGKPKKTLAVERIFQRAFAQSIFNGRDKISPVDLLVSVTNEDNCHGAYFLAVNGCHREQLIDILSDVIEGEFIEEEHDYIKNLNEEALNGGIDPLIGRQQEVTDVVEVLARRKKNNICLVGEPGVGKTAIAEGMAWKIINKQVPKTLLDKTVFQIDVGTMLAGTKFRGEFEERLKSVLDQIEKNENAILFIDEIHMIMGAGSAGSSQVDAANMLKPLLGKGKLLCIGATTPDEFASTFEKDRALMRRFCRLDIEETTLKDTIEICTGLKTYYEDFHKVKYEEGTIERACELADRYIKNKFFPDKALDIVDAAGAVAKVLGKKNC
jgi:ATP-dependent Clp protease ATP-binding subunit ClpA